MTRSDSGRARTGWRRWLQVVPALVVAAVAVWEMVAAASAGRDAGSDADWSAAADAVREEFAPGDLIVFAPDWIDPVGRRYLGELLSLDAAARMDAATYRTIWEVSIRGAAAAEVAELTAFETQLYGDVRVRKFVRDAEGVGFDFVDRFAEATVRGAVATPARAVLEEVGFEPHRCIRVEPLPAKTAEVVFREVELGARLVGYVGLADVFTLRRVRQPARFDVLVGGDQVASVVAGVDDGWVRFEAPTTPGATADVVFAATAMGPDAFDRQVCFAAEVRR